MNNDMSDIVKNLSNMLKEDQVPDNLKNILSSLSNNSSNSSDNTTQNNTEFQNNIDIDTILKMQEIIKSMNSESSSSRSNLLRSLKPYLNPTRQDKVEQYIQLLSMEKVFKMLNNKDKT